MPESASPTTFTVATWNLQWKFGEWEARQAAIRRVLGDLDAQVVTLQECWQGQVQRLAADLGYEHVWAGHDPHGDPERSLGNAVLSRWPIDGTDHRFLPDEQGREYRSIVFAGCATPWGPLAVFSTHLDHRYDRSATRQSQLQLASEFVERHSPVDSDRQLPPILAGDLNAVPDSDEIRRLTGRSLPFVQGRVWTDAWEQVGDGPGLTWSNENPYLSNSAWPNRRLDYVLIGWPREHRPVGNPASAHLFGQEPVDGIVASDHFGVAVRIIAAADHPQD